MTREIPLSRCCKNIPIRFRWFGYPSAPKGQDLEVAGRKFISVIKGTNREFNEYISAMALAEFKKKIKLAQRGQLTPSRHVKPIESANPPPLYEIRWQGVTIREITESGIREDRRLLIRMYHSEPLQLPNYFVGHHIHEKVISGDSATWLLQNEEIDTAVGFFMAGLSSNWGIELEK